MAPTEADIEQAAALDCDEFTVRLPTLDRDATLSELDRTRGMIDGLGVLEGSNDHGT